MVLSLAAHIIFTLLFLGEQRNPDDVKSWICVQIILEVGALDAIDPGLDVVALGPNAILVPLAGLEGGLRLIGKLGVPLGPAALIPEVAGRAFVALGDLALIAVHFFHPFSQANSFPSFFQISTPLN